MLLLKVGRENQRQQLINQTYSMTIAVMHSLDVGFNSGKGNILESWKESMSDVSESKPAKELFTERTQAFFDSLPRVAKKRK